MDTDATTTIREYYDSLRTGQPLPPFFAPDAGVKFGISERLTGYEEIEAGLREQTATTADWTVDSRDLRVTERDCHAWFSDEVFMAWTDTKQRIRYEFETRWSGTLEARADTTGTETATGAPNENKDNNSNENQAEHMSETESESTANTWQIVGMHVSTADTI